MKVKIPAPESEAEVTAAAGMAVEIEAGVAENPTEAPPPEVSDTAPPVKGRYDGITSFSYIGPNVLGGRLKANIVLNGTHAEITEFYKDVLAEYPSVEKLIVPVSRLADAREKIGKPGNILQKHYSDLVSAFKAKQRREE